MNVMGVLNSFSIKNIFYDKMGLWLFIFMWWCGLHPFVKVFPSPQSQKFILIRDDFVFSPSSLTLEYAETR